VEEFVTAVEDDAGQMSLREVGGEGDLVVGQVDGGCGRVLRKFTNHWNSIVTSDLVHDLTKSALGCPGWCPGDATSPIVLH
jgi:hypothetical protein